jgi:hypothetical protein
VALEEVEVLVNVSGVVVGFEMRKVLEASAVVPGDPTNTSPVGSAIGPGL